MKKTSILTTLSSEMLGFDALKSMKFGHFWQKKDPKRDEITKMTSRQSSNEQTCVPRPSWRPIWRPKRRMTIIEGATRGVIFGALGPPKVIKVT